LSHQRHACHVYVLDTISSQNHAKSIQTIRTILYKGVQFMNRNPNRLPVEGSRGEANRLAKLQSIVEAQFANAGPQGDLLLLDPDQIEPDPMDRIIIPKPAEPPSPAIPLAQAINPVHRAFRSLPIDQGFDLHRIMFRVTEGWRGHTDQSYALIVFRSLRRQLGRPLARQALDERITRADDAAYDEVVQNPFLRSKLRVYSMSEPDARGWALSWYLWRGGWEGPAEARQGESHRAAERQSREFYREIDVEHLDVELSGQPGDMQVSLRQVDHKHVEFPQKASAFGQWAEQTAYAS
jgi:hypothetical protein